MGGGDESVEVGGGSYFCFPFGSACGDEPTAGFNESFILEDSTGIFDCVCVCGDSSGWDICYYSGNGDPDEIQEGPYGKKERD